jgi:hypothetical protein
MSDSDQCLRCHQTGDYNDGFCHDCAHELLDELGVKLIALRAACEEAASCASLPPYIKTHLTEALKL